MQYLNRQKMIILAGVLFTVGTLSISAVYIPLSALENGAKRKENNPSFSSNRAAVTNSMWKNIDTNIKERKKTTD